jgi:hypothetical protein
VLQQGAFKGSISATNEIFAAGWGIKEKAWLSVYSLSDRPGEVRKGLDGIFPCVPSSPVFPSGLVGLAHQGDRLFDQEVASALWYGSEAIGFDPVPVVLARLGLADQLAADLERFPGRWQLYCNGWPQWGPDGQMEKEANSFFLTYRVRNAGVGSREPGTTPFPNWPFRYTSMEPISILATAMNESLLQSYDGVIRVAPACPAGKRARFTLHATGGFIVSSELKRGAVQWICVQSLHGNPCRIALPWAKAVAQSNLNGRSVMTDRIAEIKTKAGEIILLIPEAAAAHRWLTLPESPRMNEDVKYDRSGKAQLGLPAMY